MAMRPAFRGGGTTPSRSRAAATVQPVYETFRPMSEWQQDEESNVLLLIYLPGFLRQHLKVTTEGRNIVRVYGERLIAGNKWSRFQEDYQVPQDCNMRGIHAKFVEGILTITMLRKKVAARKLAAQETSIIPPQRTHDDQKDVPRLPSPSKSAPLVTSSDKDNFGEISESFPRDHGKTTKTSDQSQISKEVGEEKERAQVFKPSLKSQKPEKSKEEISRDHDQKTSDQIVEKLVDPSAEKVPNITNEEFESHKHKQMEPNEKQLATNVAAASSGSVDHGTRNYKQTVKSLMELNEERQLLVNVGVAVLVIVALGTYVSYTFGSSGEAK